MPHEPSTAHAHKLFNFGGEVTKQAPTLIGGTTSRDATTTESRPFHFRRQFGSEMGLREAERSSCASFHPFSLSISKLLKREMSIFANARRGIFPFVWRSYLEKVFLEFLPCVWKSVVIFLYEVFFSSFVSACCWVWCSAKTREMVFVLWWRLLEIGSKMDRICFGCVGGV